MFLPQTYKSHTLRLSWSTLRAQQRSAPLLLATGDPARCWCPCLNCASPSLLPGEIANRGRNIFPSTITPPAMDLGNNWGGFMKWANDTQVCQNLSSIYIYIRTSMYVCIRTYKKSGPGYFAVTHLLTWPCLDVPPVTLSDLCRIAPRSNHPRFSRVRTESPIYQPTRQLHINKGLADFALPATAAAFLAMGWNRGRRA